MGKLILLNLVTFMILCLLPERRGRRQELGRRMARQALTPDRPHRRETRVETVVQAPRTMEVVVLPAQAAPRAVERVAAATPTPLVTPRVLEPGERNRRRPGRPRPPSGVRPDPVRPGPGTLAATGTVSASAMLDRFLQI